MWRVKQERQKAKFTDRYILGGSAIRPIARYFGAGNFEPCDQNTVNKPTRIPPYKNCKSQKTD